MSSKVLPRAKFECLWNISFMGLLGLAVGIMYSPIRDCRVFMAYPTIFPICRANHKAANNHSVNNNYRYTDIKISNTILTVGCKYKVFSALQEPSHM